MKIDTRNGYEERIQKAIRRIVEFINACDEADLERREKYLLMFDTAKEVQDIIITSDNTGYVSNKLSSFEVRMATLTGSEKIKEDVMPVLLHDVATGTVEHQVIQLITSAQQMLQDAYGLALERNNLARSVPDIAMIQTKARELTPVMQALAKMGDIGA